MDELNLRETEWDCCIIGNGVAALWLAHAKWSAKQSVLWITSEEPYGSERALLQHAWLWDLNAAQAEFLRKNIAGAASRLEGELPPFELAIFDARSTRRFRRMGDLKADFGAHERGFFETLGAEVATGAIDVWDWHSRLHAFHDVGPSAGLTCVELAKEPRFVRVQGWPLLELKTQGGRIRAATLAGLKGAEAIDVRASSFVLSDYDENLASLVKNREDSEVLAGALKGKLYRAGFGVRLWHSELDSAPSQALIVPLVVSPEKDAGSHLIGRFTRGTGGLQSLWVGFLTEEELEDNNEILKRIKQAKRAVERAVPGFAASITREAVSFEPRMRAAGLLKSRKTEVLGATLVSDHYGPRAAVDAVEKVLAAGAAKAPARRGQAHAEVEALTRF